MMIVIDWDKYPELETAIHSTTDANLVQKRRLELGEMIADSCRREVAKALEKATLECGS